MSRLIGTSEHLQIWMSVPATQENKFIKYPEKIIQRLMSYRRQTWFSLPARAIFFMGNLRVLRYAGMPKSLEADWMIQLYKLAARTPFRCLESWWLSRKHHRCLFVTWIQKKCTKDNSSVSLRAEGHSFLFGRWSNFWKKQSILMCWIWYTFAGIWQKKMKVPPHGSVKQNSYTPPKFNIAPKKGLFQ